MFFVHVKDGILKAFDGRWAKEADELPVEQGPIVSDLRFPRPTSLSRLLGCRFLIVGEEVVVVEVVAVFGRGLAPLILNRLENKSWFLETNLTSFM